MIFKWRDYWGGRGLDEIRQAPVVRLFTSATNKMKDCRMLGQYLHQLPRLLRRKPESWNLLLTIGNVSCGHGWTGFRHAQE